MQKDSNNFGWILTRFLTAAKPIKQNLINNLIKTVFDALNKVAYGMNGEEIAESPVIRAILATIKPIIDNAEKKYAASAENGKKGGRPRKKDDAEKPNHNLEKPNHNLEKPNHNLEKPNHNLGFNLENPTKPNHNLNKDVDVDVDVEKENAPKGHERKQAFQPPTVDEVRMYFCFPKSEIKIDGFVIFNSPVQIEYA